jgi:hypothetical protein
MTPLVLTAKNLVMAVSLLLASAAATAGDPPVPTHVVDFANKLNGLHPEFRAFHAKGVVVEGSFKASPEAPPQVARNPAQSWDQENLKRNDRGCPTAIFFINPKTGLLEQCG